jgi:hypothetical protein
VGSVFVPRIPLCCKYQFVSIAFPLSFDLRLLSFCRYSVGGMQCTACVNPFRPRLYVTVGMVHFVFTVPTAWSKVNSPVKLTCVITTYIDILRHIGDIYRIVVAFLPQ